MSREMKDSGIEWIGEIPNDWNISQIGQLYIERRKKVSDKNYTPLSVTMNGVLYQLSSAAKTDAHDDRKLVKQGDFVINSRSDRRGACGISKYNGSVSLINIVLKPNENMNSSYYEWLFHTSVFSDEFYKWGHGIVDDLWTTKWQDMKKIAVPVPDLSEQKKIADFLDKRCEKIDRLIQKQQAYCELLNQYKYSLYTEKAKKLNCKRTVLGRIVKNIEQGWSPAPAERNDDGNWNVLTLAAVKYGEFISDEIKCFNGSIEKCGNLSLKRGDFLLTRSNTRELVGQVCVVDEDVKKTIFSDLIYRMTFDRRYVDPEYLKYYFQTAMMRQQISRDAHGSSSTMVKITHKDIKMWEVELPTLVEQKKYINEMRKKTAIINKLLNNHNQYTELLKDYKKSLIYEYVTGKKEVPES